MIAMIFFCYILAVAYVNAYARLAQLVEQRIYTAKVGSSSLSSRTIKNHPFKEEVVLTTH